MCAGQVEELPKVARSRRDAPDALDRAPDALIAPRKIGRGFVLAGVYSQAEGAVQLYYSDGLLGLSVFEREGELDWDALPSGGRDGEARRDARPRLPRPSRDRPWCGTADGITYTCVTDAPVDELAAIVAGMDAADEPGVMEDIGHFVTAPFSWG